MAVAIAGRTSAWSTNHASPRPRGRTRIGSACGSTNATRTARPIRWPIRRNTGGPRSAPAARQCQSARTTASRAVSWVCASFQIPISTQRRKRNGTRSATTPIRPTTIARTWSGPIASACPVRSVMSAQAQSIRRRIPRSRNGRTSRQIRARNTSGSIASSFGTRDLAARTTRQRQTKEVSSTSCSTPIPRAAWILPSSPRTT